MQQIYNRKFLFLGLLSAIFWAGTVRAVCPICVVAVGAGLGLSEWLGIDDTISSLWIGALLTAMVLWTLIWLKNKKWNFTYDGVVIFLAYYLLTFVPLYYSGILGHPLNKFLGTDKIIFGTVIGSTVFMLAHWFNLYLKNKNKGKVFFPYQKVVLPVVILILASLILWIILMNL